MKQAIALTSACAIFLMPVQSAIAAEPNASGPGNQASPIEIGSPSPAAKPQGSSVIPRAPVELSSQSTGFNQLPESGSPTATPQPLLDTPTLAQPSSPALITSSPLAPSPSGANGAAAASLPNTEVAAAPATTVPAPAQITTNAPAVSDKAQIVSALPAQTVKELQEQYRTTPGMIPSHGEQPIADGPQQCVAAGQCGNRNAIGFSMLAWGAALAGLIGLIVWIGKAGPDPCCGSESSCCR